MTDRPSLAVVAQTIGQMTAGEQAWFWLAPKRMKGAPQLMITPFRTDPSMTQLSAWSSTIELDVGVVPYMGMCVLREDGRFEFSGSLIDEGALKITAKWVSKASTRFPELSRLSNATFARIHPRGIVTAIYRDPNCWTEEPVSAVEAAAELLDSAEVGETFWCWLSSIGPDLRPGVRLVPIIDDPEGAYFASMIGALMLRCPGSSQHLMGSLRKSTEGPWVFVTSNDTSNWPQLRQAIADAYGPRYTAYYSLSTAVALNLSAQEGAQTSNLPSISLQTIGALAAGDRFIFVFGANAVTGQSQLFLAANKSELQGSGLDKSQPMIRGRGIHKGSFMLLQGKAAEPGLLSSIIAWCGSLSTTERASMSSLKGLRFIAKSDTGETLDRQRDESGWAAIFPS